MQRDNSAELRFRIMRKQRFKRPFRPKARAPSGNFFDSRNKLRIESDARLSKRLHRHLSGILRRRRKTSRAGPRRFLPRLLPVENRHAQTGTRKFQRDGSADYPAACDRRVELLHDVILAHLPEAFFAAAGLPPLALVGAQHAAPFLMSRTTCKERCDLNLEL